MTDKSLAPEVDLIDSDNLAGAISSEQLPLLRLRQLQTSSGLDDKPAQVSDHPAPDEVFSDCTKLTIDILQGGLLLRLIEDNASFSVFHQIAKAIALGACFGIEAANLKRGNWDELAVSPPDATVPA